LLILFSTIINIKYDKNGIFQSIFENHKRFFDKFFELDIYQRVMRPKILGRGRN